MNVHLVAVNVLSLCLTLLSLVVKPSPYRWMFWPLILIVGFIYYYFTWILEQGQPVDSSKVAILIPNIFNASHYILLIDVQRELRMVGQRESISSSGFWARLKWGLQLFFSGRGVGWTHEPRSVLPPHPTLSRIQFVMSRLGWLITYLLINDVVTILVRKSPFFVKGALPFALQPLEWRFWSTLLFAIGTSVHITIPHLVCSIICVGSGFSRPDMWPHLFGKWSDAYTIRRFWGRTWHQLLRGVLSSHGKYLAQRVFGFPSGSNLSSYTQLYTAFLISGLIHCISYDARPLRFFLSQAVGITFEDAIIAWAGRAGLKNMHRYIGYLWVYCWFVFSLAPWMDSLSSVGAFDSDGVEFSLILRLYRWKWHSARG